MSGNQCKSVRISELLTQQEIKTIFGFLVNNKEKEAKDYLNEPERKNKLEQKGILSDYLFYLMQYKLLTNKSFK